MKKTLINASLGYIIAMLTMGLSKERDFIWWIFQVGGYILVISSIIIYYSLKSKKQNKINEKESIINKWEELKS